MNLLTRSAGIAMLAAIVLLSGTARQAHALSPFQRRSIHYDILLMDSLLGTAVGGAAGLTVGVLGDAESEDIFSDYMLPGMGIGALSGVIYGLLYNSGSSLFYNDIYMHNGQPKGLLHFDVNSSVLDLRSVRALPRSDIQEKDRPKWRVNLFTMSF